MLEKLFLMQDKLHADLSDLIVKGLLAVELVWNCSEQAISISSYLFHGHIRLVQLSDHF